MNDWENFTETAKELLNNQLIAFENVKEQIHNIEDEEQKAIVQSIVSRTVKAIENKDKNELNALIPEVMKAIANNK